MLYKHTITLIIPCRNEEKALRQLLHKVPRFVDEVLVVDNGSTDKTTRVAKKYGAQVVKEYRQVDGIGYGYAHQRGILNAKGDIIVTMDGDNTYPLEDVRKAVNYLLKNDLDFVSCSRFPLTNKEAISDIRQLGVSILNIEASLLYGQKIKDILSGMWVAKRRVVRRLDLREGGWNFSPEIKLAALTATWIRFAEFHINHHYRSDGESKQIIWKTGLEHLWYICKRRFTTDNFLLQQLPQWLTASPTLADV